MILCYCKVSDFFLCAVTLPWISFVRRENIVFDNVVDEAQSVDVLTARTVCAAEVHHHYSCPAASSFRCAFLQELCHEKAGLGGVGAISLRGGYGFFGVFRGRDAISRRVVYHPRIASCLVRFPACSEEEDLLHGFGFRLHVRFLAGVVEVLNEQAALLRASLYVAGLAVSMMPS